MHLNIKIRQRYDAEGNDTKPSSTLWAPTYLQHQSSFGKIPQLKRTIRWNPLMFSSRIPEQFRSLQRSKNLPAFIIPGSALTFISYSQLYFSVLALRHVYSLSNGCTRSECLCAAFGSHGSVCGFERVSKLTA